MNPAMIGTWIFGVLLIANSYSNINFLSFWFLMKMLCVVIMTGFHGYYAYCRKKIALDNLFKTSQYFRLLNEVPAFLLIIILIMIIIRPYN